MHTYRRFDDHRGNGWQVIYQHSQEPRYEPLGPIFDFEWEAAAYASFLNGGRYCPDEIAPIFPREPLVEDDDSTYPRPQGMDYEPEAARK